MAYLRSQFRQALKQHIEYELPLIYNQSMHRIAEIIKHAYSIFNKAEVPDQIKLHVLNLIAECQQRRLDMATSGEIIEHGIQFVEHMRDNVNNLVKAVPQDQVRKMLHEEGIGNDDIWE
jgi:hypothetical protein